MGRVNSPTTGGYERKSGIKLGAVDGGLDEPKNSDYQNTTHLKLLRSPKSTPWRIIAEDTGTQNPHTIFYLIKRSEVANTISAAIADR